MEKYKKTSFSVIFLVICIALLPVETVYAKRFKLDENLEPEHISTKEINNFYKDIVVVQRKAKKKRETILFNPYFQFDFSDGPSTLYSFNTNIGYAFSDFWEAYLNLVPVFVPIERDTVGYVESLTLIDGKNATLEYSKPQYQVMAEILWAPAYGKDSWGPDSIIRSDTFFKLAAGAIMYQDGEAGARVNFVLGKTFFIGDGFNLRIAAGGSVVETFIQQKSKYYFMGTMDFGLIWYM